MPLERTKVDTVTVDSYGTLVDPNSIQSTLSDHVENPAAVANLWFSRSLMNKMVGNFIDVYQPFEVLSEDGLEYALEYRDIDLDEAEKTEILNAYDRLDIYPEVKEGIERIADLGYEIYVVSNGTPSMLDRLVNHVGISDAIMDTISAHEIELYKPDAEIYRHTAARTGTPIDRILHVSGPYFDVLGAMYAGMQGGWINYVNKPRDTFAGGPDIEISSFNELAEELPHNS